MVAYELDESGRIRFPVVRKALELREDRRDTRGAEQRDRVFRVLVEVGIEDALVHEVRIAADVEEHPAEIVELQRRQHIGCTSHGVFERLSVSANLVRGSGFDL